MDHQIKSTSLTFRIDAASRKLILDAAQRRGLGISEYVRRVAIAEAHRDIASVGQEAIRMTPDQLFAFWKSLQRRPRLTAAQKRLAKLMRSSHK